MVESRTVEERIAAMKRRIKEEEEIAEEAAERHRQVAAKLRSLVTLLREALEPLNGLPFWGGHTRQIKYSTSVMQDALVREDGYSNPPIKVQIGSGAWHLMTFLVQNNPETKEVWIEHDGDRVSVDVATDLAVAAVERALAIGEPPPAPEAPPDDDSNIPF